MKLLCIWLWLACIPAFADLRHEIGRACRRDPGFYSACLANLAGQYRAGYRAYDLFAYLDHPGPIPLKTQAGVRVETGFPLDLALDGSDFLVLNGNRLVRSGAFRLRGGRLCNAQGDTLLSTRLQPIEIPEAAQIRVSEQGDVEFIRMSGDGKYETAGRLGLARVAHPQWLSPTGTILKPTPRSGPMRLGGKSRVLSQQLELGNASPLEQQKTCRALFDLAENVARARRDLMNLIAQHDRLCAASLENLKHLSESGYRANDIFETRLRPTQGRLLETRSPYDVAIDGQGYFRLSNGLLTRDGSFQLTREGRLVNQDGLALQGMNGPIQIPADMSEIVIKGDGTVAGTRLNGDGHPETLDQIWLAQVEDGAFLQRSGRHLKATDRAGALRTDAPGKNGLGVLAQGYIEVGNVNPIEQIKMLHALRNYAHLLGMPLADDFQP